MLNGYTKMKNVAATTLRTKKYRNGDTFFFSFRCNIMKWSTISRITHFAKALQFKVLGSMSKKKKRLKIKKNEQYINHSN